MRINLILFTCLVVIFFLFFLWPGKQYKDQTLDYKSFSIPKNEIGLEAPSIKYDLHSEPNSDSLNKEKYFVTKNTQWVIEVNKYSSKQELLKDYLYLKESGYRVFSREKFEQEELIYFLFIGPNHDRAFASSEIDKIKSLLPSNPIVKQYKE